MRPGGQLERVLTGLTVDVHQARRHRTRQLTDTGTGEDDQQIRIPVSGTANSTPVFVDRYVTWEQPFLYAPQQRRVPFKTPQFEPGFEFTTPPVDGDGNRVWVDLSAYVMGWTTSPELWVVGALVTFGATAPAVVTGGVTFSGIAHLNFQGYTTQNEGWGDVTPAPLEGG